MANQLRKNGRKEHTSDPGGVGTEIVREIQGLRGLLLSGHRRPI